MEVIDILEELRCRALRDPELRMKLLDSSGKNEPIESFCGICREYGYELYEMDLICAGEEFYASMKRSTNGGGENSPQLSGQDDFYELFLAGLK